jgi:hypothetical protein
LAQLPQQRTKREYALFMKAYALFMKALAHRYPDALKIRVVQDNLNTHNASAR